MKSLMIITFLLFAISSKCCYGNNKNNCTGSPKFVNSQYLTEYHCYAYSLPPITGDEVNMTVDMSPQDGVTLIWYTHEDGIISCNSPPCIYLFSNHNKTMVWVYPNKYTIFYINATNSCGENASACFIVEPLCPSCTDCPIIPAVTTNSVTVPEYADHTFDATITAEYATAILQWCFVRSKNYHNCCACDSTDNCPDGWSLTSHYNCTTYQYTCSLTIHNILQNYTNGVLISNVTVLGEERSRTVNRTHIIIAQNNDDSQSTTVYPFIAMACVIIAFIAIVICVIFLVYMIRRNHHCFNYYKHMCQHKYESLPSTAPARRRASDSSNEESYNNNDDVTSRDLDYDIHTPYHNV